MYRSEDIPRVCPPAFFDLELVCNRAGTVDVDNAKGFSFCRATAVSSAAGKCFRGVVSLIISFLRTAPGPAAAQELNIDKVVRFSLL
jgi:hypothetical protein